MSTQRKEGAMTIHRANVAYVIDCIDVIASRNEVHEIGNATLLNWRDYLAGVTRCPKRGQTWADVHQREPRLDEMDK